MAAGILCCCRAPQDESKMYSVWQVYSVRTTIIIINKALDDTNEAKRAFLAEMNRILQQRHVIVVAGMESESCQFQLNASDLHRMTSQVWQPESARRRQRSPEYTHYDELD